MGVNHLWAILEPVKKQQSLADLSGSLFAVDLSIWIMESKLTQPLASAVQKPYLRNLFFRIATLYNLGVKLVFVVDGKPPEIKAATIKGRLQNKKSRIGGGKKQESAAPIKRTRFQRTVNECIQLLDSMGVPYVKAEGEAEAMCAFLNMQGLVNGCITDDGDAFLYGASLVCRNFTMDSKDPHVDSYCMEDIERKLNLDREKLIGLAVLLGCDYFPKGVSGVGRITAVSLMQKCFVDKVSVLERFDEWVRRRSEVLPDAKPTHCSCCQHPGSKREHNKFGCRLCGLLTTCLLNDKSDDCPCEWHRKDNERLEVGIRSKALKTDGFPAEATIHEFLHSRDRIPKIDFVWRQPCLSDFVHIAVDKMGWTLEYSAEKIIPLMTRWQMLQVGHSLLLLKPYRIVKTRVKQRVPSLEVEWLKPEELNLPGDYVVTIEPMDLFCQAFAELYVDFQTEKLQKKKKSKPGRKKRDIEDLTKGLSDITNRVNNISLNSKGSLEIKMRDSLKSRVNKRTESESKSENTESLKLYKHSMSMVPKSTNNPFSLVSELVMPNLNNHDISRELILDEAVDTFTKSNPSTEANITVKPLQVVHVVCAPTALDDFEGSPLPLALRIKTGHTQPTSARDTETNQVESSGGFASRCSDKARPNSCDVSVIIIDSEGEESFSQKPAALLCENSCTFKVLRKTDDLETHATHNRSFETYTSVIKIHQLNPEISMLCNVDSSKQLPLSLQVETNHLSKLRQETDETTSDLNPVSNVQQGSNSIFESVIVIGSDDDDDDDDDSFCQKLPVASKRPSKPDVDQSLVLRVEEHNLSFLNTVLDDWFIEPCLSPSLHTSSSPAASNLSVTHEFADTSKDLFGTPS